MGCLVLFSFIVFLHVFSVAFAHQQPSLKSVESAAQEPAPDDTSTFCGDLATLKVFVVVVVRGSIQDYLWKIHGMELSLFGVIIVGRHLDLDVFTFQTLGGRGSLLRGGKESGKDSSKHNI